MHDEEEQSDAHFLRRWISVGDVIGLCLSLVALGVTYGKLSTDVQHTNETIESIALAVAELQSRDITPGARAQLSAVQATDAALQQQVNLLREELRSQRAEIIGSLERVERRLEEHDRK